jgi:hypothetical protein
MLSNIISPETLKLNQNENMDMNGVHEMDPSKSDNRWTNGQPRNIMSCE